MHENEQLTPTVQKRLIALLEYIEQVEKLNRNPAFVVPTEFYCAYEDELRGLPGVEFDTAAEGDEVWLRVPRLKEQDPPLPDAALGKWLVLSKNPDKEPSLREELTVPGENRADSSKTLRRADSPDIDVAFQWYLQTVWRPWSEYERPRRRTIGLYSRLFLLQQALEAEGADMPLELMWGIGIALWAHESGQRISHPVLTQSVELNLDTQSLALEVRPRDRLPTLESDPYAALNIVGIVPLEASWRAHSEKAELTLSPFDSHSFTSVLKATVGFLDASGRYWPEVRTDAEDRALPRATANLTVTDTWVLFARKRSPSFLIEDLERLKKNLESSSAVPGGPAALVMELAQEVVDKVQVFFRGLSYAGELPPGAQAKELYFPKLYNAEQVSIVQKLETSDGVVVQGPPGTGKTHTIANVICHYLANGKRVLVTSKGEPALAVLRDQIPESVRALTVALLTDEKDGMRQFEHAIQTIAATISRIFPADVEREIQSLSNHVDELHAKLSAIDREIAGWAARHMKRLRFKGREILPEELARYVVDNESGYGWFLDALSAQPTEMRFSHADIVALRQARLSLGADLTYLGAEVPAADSFPDGHFIARLHEDLTRARRMASEMEEGGLPPLVNTAPETLEKAQALFELVQEGLRLFDAAYGARHPYTAQLHAHYLSGNVNALQGLDNLVQVVLGLERERQGFVQRPVEVHAHAERDEEFIDAVERARVGRRPLGLLSFGRSELRSKLEGVTISGLPPQDETDWTHVYTYVEFRRRVRATVARWNATAAEFQLTAVSTPGTDAVKTMTLVAEHIALVKRLAMECGRHVPALVSQVFGEGAPSAELGQDRQLLSELQDMLSKHLTRWQLAYASGAVADLTAKLAGKAGVVVDSMQRFFTRELGELSMNAAEAAVRWSGFLAELRRLAALRGAFAEVLRVAELVEHSVAPNWARALRSEPAGHSDDKWTPPDWLEAWNWRYAKTFLEAIDGREALKRLQLARRDTEQDLAHTYQRLVEQKTWIEVHRNSPSAVKGALQAYLNAVKHIGKGTGIRAVRYRKEARTAMLDAYRAVPCWIMPQWRVSETLPAEIGKFDLVIIDEASQSDLWALPCLLRGAKLMVVGDDKQVSPDGIGLAEEKIKELKNRFLRDQVHGDQMTPEKSLYDLAKVVFAGEMVMLREHFRCVAPIIEFSKREFYNHEIRPLRIPKGSERLDPPLIDVFVKGAYRKGKVNEAEARAIVDEITVILEDPRCAKRSIGVVSLLGIEQAHRIFELIKDELPAEEIVSRKITVGDARTFQGKERDIMLMSMVATPEEKMTATGSTYEQRFNVAASRAKDRMYLFRSVELSDLNKIDLKARLIEHFRAPFHQDPLKVSSWRELCQSGFEREMYDLLTGKGYRVRPQVQVGAYSIDLVIDGEEDRRLAIECDGDQYHGPERWGADMARQRVLERAGWSFWRCFASTFTLNQLGVVDDLMATLRKMGIEPTGAAELDLGRYTEHRTVDPYAVGSAVKGVMEGPNNAQPIDTAAGSASTREHERPIPSTSTVEFSSGRPSAHGRVERHAASAREPNLGLREYDSGPREAFSEEALYRFLDASGLKSEDNRRKGGAQWVFAEGHARDVIEQLRTWGFQLKAGKGWWRK